MDLRIQTASPDGVRDVLARLHDLERWPVWFGDASNFDVVRRGPSSEVSLVLQVPRQIALRLEVLTQTDGVVVMLIEGELQGVEVEVQVEPDGDGSLVKAHIWVQFPVSVPGTLLREIEEVLVPRWLNAVAGS